MMAHARAYQPLLCNTLSDDELRPGVIGLVEKAIARGFETRGQARLFVELGLIFGYHFETDPQYPWIAEILKGTKEPFPELKARALHRRANAYMEAVFGKDGEHAMAARRQLQGRVDFETPKEDELDTFLLGTLEQLHPQKFAEVGETPLRALIAKARRTAARWEMVGPRPVGLVAILMSQFGHGCDHDPFYPWIARSINHERLPDGTARAKRLEQRARTWLRVVLERADAGGYDDKS